MSINSANNFEERVIYVAGDIVKSGEQVSGTRTDKFEQVSFKKVFYKFGETVSRISSTVVLTSKKNAKSVAKWTTTFAGKEILRTIVGESIKQIFKSFFEQL